MIAEGAKTAMGGIAVRVGEDLLEVGRQHRFVAEKNHECDGGDVTKKNEADNLYIECHCCFWVAANLE